MTNDKFTWGPGDLHRVTPEVKPKPKPRPGIVDITESEIAAGRRGFGIVGVHIPPAKPSGGEPTEPSPAPSPARKARKTKLPKGIFLRGKTYWIRYSERGIARYESAKTEKVSEAESLRADRLAAIRSGNYITPELAKITIDELVQDVMADYETNGLKSLKSVKQRWTKNLEPFFHNKTAASITTDTVNAYKKQRLKDENGAEKAKPATVNRELAILKRAFSLGRKSTPPKVKSTPYIPMIKESNTRHNFLESGERDKLAAECAKVGLWLRAIFEVGITYGWRFTEIVSLKVRQIDLSAPKPTIRLDAGSTKNGEGRLVTMTSQVRELITACVAGKSRDQFVFTRSDGEAIIRFDKCWRKACTDAGVPELLFHDLRRSAVRDLLRRGVLEKTAMEITGHKTRAIFDRYHIVNEREVAAATELIEAGQAAEKKALEEFSGRVVSDKNQTISTSSDLSTNEARRPAVLPN